MAQHDERVKKLLAQVRISGLKLHVKKSVMLTNRVEYIGHAFSGNGLSPSPDHISSVLRMPYPTNETEVKIF